MTLGLSHVREIILFSTGSKHFIHSFKCYWRCADDLRAMKNKQQNIIFIFFKCIIFSSQRLWSLRWLCPSNQKTCSLLPDVKFCHIAFLKRTSETTKKINRKEVTTETLSLFCLNSYSPPFFHLYHLISPLFLTLLLFSDNWFILKIFILTSKF